MPTGAEQRTDHGGHHRRVEAVFGRQASDGRKGYALRQYD